MTANPEPAPDSSAHPHRGWAWLAIALGWVALARVPLVLNAGAHLDSDLAVDGLTLIDALNGRWRWHYPATPFIGSPPVLLSYVQAKLAGPTPMALVSGGLVAYALVVSATYGMNRRAFGPAVAAWGLVPLAFASTGTIWLSGRVTGGHLLASAWHAGAFALLWGALTRGGWRRSAALGLWCGFGLYVDSMFAATWAGLFAATLVRAFSSRGKGEESGARRLPKAAACLLAFALASGVGVIPRVIGSRVDPYDGYRGQLDPDLRPAHIGQNAWILAADCLPRLIAGHRLPGLQAEPGPSQPTGGSPEGIPWLAFSLTVFSLYLFGRGMVALARGGSGSEDSPSIAIRWGLLASSAVIVAGFLVNWTIVNSDNYRYLVFLLVPWSSGFGLMMARGAAKGPSGLRVSVALAVVLAGLMTVDSARWYARLGWVDSTFLPTRKAVDDPALAWLEGHPEVMVVRGDYWDAYRLAFLVRGRVKAVPFPQYPDRFPEVKDQVLGLEAQVVVARPEGFGPRYRARAMARGGRELMPGRGVSIVEWPRGMKP